MTKVSPRSTTSITVSRLGELADKRLFLFGRLWETHERLKFQIMKAGGVVVPEGPRDGAYLVLSSTLLVPKDSIGLEYDLIENPAAQMVRGWLADGAQPIAERDLREALKPSALSRHRARQIEEQSRLTLDACEGVMRILNEVIDDERNGP